ncbi:MAG: two-component system response regulator [Granulosicoccus sp.]
MNLAIHQTTAPSMPIDIVVIDDDQLTLEIVSWIFRGSQASHRLFDDPDIAMTYLCESIPRILIVDYYMPTQNGIEFLTQLKTVADLEECSVYLCSAVEPRTAQLEQVKALRAQVLDKSKLCDRSVLLGLVECGRYETGNK